MVNANEILDSATPRNEVVSKYIRDVADWLHEMEGELHERDELKQMIQDEFDLDVRDANAVLSELVGDTVDPVVQVSVDGTPYVGIIEFVEFDGAYGYVDWDEYTGKRKRVVCQQCVNDATRDRDVTHATEFDPDGSFADGASYEELLDGIHEHYEQAHDDVTPDEIETGATLVSGTTIGGQIAWHRGNDGAGSNLDADLIEGRSVYTQSSEPSNPNVNDIWIDTS